MISMRAVNVRGAVRNLIRTRRLPTAWQSPLRNIRWKSTSSSSSSAVSSLQSDNVDKTPSEGQMEMKVIKELFQYVWPRSNDPESTNRKARVVASLSLMVGGKLVIIETPYLFKHLVDSMPVAEQMTSMAASDPALMATSSIPLALLLGYGSARAGAAGMQELRNVVFLKTAQDAIRSVGRKVFDHVHQLDMQFHLERNTGQLSRVLDRGNRSIAMVLNSMVFHVIPTILEVSLVTGLMTYQFGLYHSAVVLGTVGSYVGFTTAVTSWRTKFRKDMIRLENEASGRIVDSLLNYETVQYFNNTKHEGERYEESLRGYQEATLQSQSSLGFLNFGQSVIFSAGMAGVMGLTCQQIIDGTATVGDLVLVNGLLFQLSVPLFFIGFVYREVKQAFTDMEAMTNLTEQQSRVLDKESAIEYNPSSMGTAIRFEDIRFAYPSSTGSSVDRPILKGTTLEIPDGKTVAFVGSSGCGKSTLLRLLYRFYEADSGSITVGGHDVKDLSTDSLRRSIAVVPQDTVLFHESIRYNIQYGDLDATPEEVEEAAKKAKIHDTILSFPDGYDTVVGERGLKLSGGEKQRVAIARAILKKSSILLCDEPTSSLDTATEMDIMNNLKEVGKDNTTVIIAHRLSTIQDCDEIVVLHEGTVAERGTHEELLQKGGMYTELLRMQQKTQEGNLVEDGQ